MPNHIYLSSDLASNSTTTSNQNDTSSSEVCLVCRQSSNRYSASAMHLL